MAGIVYGLRGPVLFRKLPCTASEAFKKGDWLLASSGAVVTAQATANTAVGSTTALVGTAMEDAQDINGVTKSSVVCAIAKPGVEFEICIGPATTTYVLPATHLGQSYELIKTPTGLPYGFYVTVSGTTNDHVRIVDFVGDGDLPTWPDLTTNASASNGVANGRVWVEPLAAVCFFSGARAAT